MSELKKGDRVTVDTGDNSIPFNGVITGEGRSGHWWNIRKDGTTHPKGYHKDYCRPEWFVDPVGRERND
jgi:hypothetical protein